MRHLAYEAMLAFCVAGTLPLVPAFRLTVLRQPRRLALAIAQLAGKIEEALLVRQA